MNNPTFKLLVLTDLSKSAAKALDNAVNLAKIINGSIDVFHVLKPSDIAEYENQYSAMRTIDEERYNTKNKLKTLVREISKRENIQIQASFRLGNLKSEVLEEIENAKPDIIVLGKRPPRIFNFLGDSFTKFILKNFNGSVLISGKNTAIRTTETMSLGLLNTTTADLPQGITTALRRRIKKPIRQFFVRNASEENTPETVSKAENVITFEFENSSNAIDNVATYVSKNNIGLLCVNRHAKKNSRFKNITSNIKEAIHKINVPILIVKNSSTIQLQ
ncbi:universal stress protein [Kordia jejudonensis]|uniref:universal stress protein n=1 Tax=Kordia jejudonensis TaxID=1348245 RepID=UPI0006293B97|nr:universal stress protein [Kordia jejudonensis]